VFTDTALTGNPLAVVHGSEGLDDARMLATANEFNLCETGFLLPPDDPHRRAKLRIFTPGAELPFAGLAIAEDPATGSAAACLAGALVDNEDWATASMISSSIGALRWADQAASNCRSPLREANWFPPRSAAGPSWSPKACCTTEHAKAFPCRARHAETLPRL